MALEKDLCAKSIPIIEAKLDATEFVLKLLLLRCGPIIEFKNKSNDGRRQQLVFVDEEGTKIQGTLFSQFTEKWKNVLEAGKVFYVINGRIRRPKENYNNVNKEMELAITQFSEIRACESTFLTKEFSNGFSSLDQLEHMDRSLQYDIFGIFIEASSVIETERSKRRVVVIANETNVRVSITLWRDHAVHDAAPLEVLESCKSIVAFCNVRVTEFNGTLAFASSCVTSIVVNPNFVRANELLLWNEGMIAKNIDIGLLPSRQIIRATEVKISKILYDRFDNPQNVYCKFNATIKEVMHKERVCYPACKKCTRKVEIQGSSIFCKHCAESKVDFTYRYFLKLILTDEKIKLNNTNGSEVLPNSDDAGALASENKKMDKNITGDLLNNDDAGDLSSEKKKMDKNINGSELHPNTDNEGGVAVEENKLDNTLEKGKGESDTEDIITVKLFEAGKFLYGCSAVQYMSSVADKLESSEYYQRMLLSEGQRFTFLVKNYHSTAQEKRATDLVIEEMHMVGLAGYPDIEHAETTTSALGKRLLQHTDEEDYNSTTTSKKKK